MAKYTHAKTPEATPVQRATVDQVADQLFSTRQKLSLAEYLQLKDAANTLGVHLRENRLQHNETLYALRVVVDHLNDPGRQLFVDTRGGA